MSRQKLERGLHLEKSNSTELMLHFFMTLADEQGGSYWCQEKQLKLKYKPSLIWFENLRVQFWVTKQLLTPVPTVT